MAKVLTPKVLIVEDDVQLSNMYAAKLKLEGFEVVIANEGRSGLEAATREKPDIIVMDIMLIDRDYSGLTMLEDLRKTPEGKDIPVIALTNLTKKEVADKAEELGVRKYLIKAMYTPEEVVKHVTECLQPTVEHETSPQE
jgi:DNA-binding response OmpR family regulator